MTSRNLALFAIAWAANAIAVAACSEGESSGNRMPASDLDGGVGADGARIPLPDAAPFDAGGDATPRPTPVGDGHVTFRLQDGWYRIAGKESSTPEGLTTELDRLSSGSDAFLNISKDGNWLVTTGSRFSCTTGSCLDEFRTDLSQGNSVSRRGGGMITTAQGRPAVSVGGDVVVYPAHGPHNVDLYAIKRVAGIWEAPVLLTGDSSFSYHHDVAIAFDGSRILCDCGDDPYGVAPTAICEVATDGTGFQVVVKPDDGPDHSTSHAVHHADYTPEGDYVFEADWPSETVWKVTRGANAPVRISPDSQTNDNSPCVLPDGRIVSLWLGRPGNPGNHELKVMNPDGSGAQMILTDVDVVDIGIGCGN